MKNNRMNGASKIRINREDCIEQLIMSLGVFEFAMDNVNLSAVAEKLANELCELSENQAKRKLLGVKNH